MEYRTMLDLHNILSLELTNCRSNESINKKQILEQISHLIHKVEPNIKYQEVLNTLQQRERLGSTAIGHGIAIPHGRVIGLDKSMCALISLKQAIEFDAPDGIDVDIIFGLLVPQTANEAQLQILATLTEKLKSVSYRQQLRNAKTNDILYHAAITTD